MTFYHCAVCCCTLNNTWDCDEHLFGQVSTGTGRSQLPIFGCTKVRPWRCAHPRHRCAVFYSDKLPNVQVVINWRYSVAQMSTCEDKLPHSLGALYFDDVMSYNSLTTIWITNSYLLFKWAIQMAGTLVLGIWIADRYTNGGLDTSPLTKWWSKYWTSCYSDPHCMLQLDFFLLRHFDYIFNYFIHFSGSITWSVNSPQMMCN